MVAEDPGTVPVLANGRGYAIFLQSRRSGAVDRRRARFQSPRRHQRGAFRPIRRGYGNVPGRLLGSPEVAGTSE